MPKNKPEIVQVPRMNYIAVRGKGNPNIEGGEMKFQSIISENNLETYCQAKRFFVYCN